MVVDACFLFRGDIRFDTRLRNFVRAWTDEGRTCVVVQGGASGGSFVCDGARVESFVVGGRGPLGFLDYWVRAAARVAHIEARTYWAAELYSLPLAVWRARVTRGRAAYDARELFAHLGALRGKRARQKFWYGLERTLIARADAVITSGAMDAEYLEERYDVAPPHVVRNLPPYRPPRRTTRIAEALHLPVDMPIALYTGGLQQGRGIDAMLVLAEHLPECAFVFLGDGPLAARIDEAASRLPNVHHLPAVPNAEVMEYTASATLGFALIEPITLSYFLALPNKLFEYIMAGTPVVVTHLPQMEAIVERYGVGIAVPPECAGDILEAVRAFLADAGARARAAARCEEAARELCWERERAGFLAFARAQGLL